MLTLAGILLFIAAVHSCWNGGRLARAARSSDPEIRGQARQTIGIMGIIGVLCLLYLLWPVLLVIGAVWLLAKFLGKKS